ADGEARRPLGVEGTEALVRAARLAEAHDVLDEREDLHRCLDTLDRLVLDAGHALVQLRRVGECKAVGHPGEVVGSRFGVQTTLVDERGLDAEAATDYL